MHFNKLIYLLSTKNIVLICIRSQCFPLSNSTALITVVQHPDMCTLHGEMPRNPNGAYLPYSKLQPDTPASKGRILPQMVTPHAATTSRVHQNAPRHVWSWEGLLIRLFIGFHVLSIMHIAKKKTKVKPAPCDRTPIIPYAGVAGNGNTNLD